MCLLAAHSLRTRMRSTPQVVRIDDGAILSREPDGRRLSDPHKIEAADMASRVTESIFFKCFASVIQLTHRPCAAFL